VLVVQQAAVGAAAGEPRVRRKRSQLELVASVKSFTA
jgi:hypothetical protein